MPELPQLIEEVKEALANASPCPDPDIDYYRGPSCDVSMLLDTVGKLVKELNNYNFCSSCQSIVRKL